MTLSDVVWTRLYEEDLETIEELAKKELRKKSQIVRILVNEALQKRKLEENNDRRR